MMGAAQQSFVSPGRTIAGKYRVVGLLGAGSMGQVYEAVQLGLDRHVAIKVLHPNHRADERYKARFHREALAASKLDHPNSLRILDFGEDHDGLLYIAMELICGRSVYELVRSEAVSFARAVDIVSQVLSALAAAHDQGIIHRDIKPENVFLVPVLDDSGATVERVKVCDFGIAQIQETAEDAESASGGGMVCGTPEFMSPEQARGLPLDARSDLYACGILLYELVAGRVPFGGDSAVMIALQQISDLPVSPSAIRPGIPERLEQIILKTLEKEPADRPQSARELRAELCRVLEEPTIPVAAPALMFDEPAAALARAFKDEETLPELQKTPLPTVIEHSGTLPGMPPLLPPPSSGGLRWLATLVRRTHARISVPATMGALAMVLAGVGLGPRQEPGGEVNAAREATTLGMPAIPQLGAEEAVAPIPPAPPEDGSGLEVFAAISAVRSSSAMPAAYVRAAAARVRPGLESCWARAPLPAGPDAAPVLWAEVVFDRQGRAERARATARGPLPDGLANCVRTKLSRMRTAHRPYAAHGRASFAIRFELRAAAR